MEMENAYFNDINGKWKNVLKNVLKNVPYNAFSIETDI